MIDLKSMAVGEHGSPPFRIFASHEEALSHICDHVLTRPEAHYWSVLIQCYRELVDPTEDSDLDSIADAFWREERQDETQALYDGYAREVSLAVSVAFAQQWRWEVTRLGKTKGFGIGSSGVLVVWSGQVVLSALLKPYAAPKPNRDISHHDRTNDSRPRRATWAAKHGKLLSFQPADSEQTRFKLFIKSFSSVRRKVLAASRGGRTSRNTSMPAEAQIPSLDEWRRISEDASSRLARLEPRL